MEDTQEASDLGRETEEGGSAPNDQAVETTPLTADQVTAWLKEITKARKREASYRKEGKSYAAIYEAEKTIENEFNILFSNTETLAPALYSTVPTPVIARRFRTADPVGLAGAEVIKRAIQFLADSGDKKYPTFDELLNSAVLDALIPGRGVTRFSYHGEVEPSGQVTECVYGSEVPWDRFLLGYGRTWVQVPWIGYEHRMAKEEVESNFGEGQAEKLTFTESSDNGGKEDGALTDIESKGVPLVTIYEIWDKESKKVHFLPEQADVGGLRSVEDPLGLSGFFNCPRPLRFTKRVSGQTPIAPYKMYKTQAEELNLISARINALVAMMKVRGYYDGSLEKAEELLRSPDGSMLPLENVAALYSSGGSRLDAAFWFFPIEKLVGVLQQLYNQREAVKQVIYEITGISDILRGSSVASETATAQNIKNQWGTLRLKNLQKEVARYAKDCMRIMGEITAEKFSQETLQVMTEVDIPTEAEKQQAQMEQQAQEQQAMQEQQMSAMQGAAPPMPGQPPAPPPAPPQPPPPPPPEFLALMEKPSWEDVVQMLRSDFMRNYKIDIETNSTIDPDNSEDQKNISDLMNGLSQVMNGMAPLIQSGQMPFNILKNLLLVVSRRFAFGAEIEEELKGMQQPPPPPEPQPDPLKQQEMELRVQEAQATVAAAQEKAKADQQLASIKLEMEQAKAVNEQAKMELEMQLMRQQATLEQAAKEQEHAMRMTEMNQKAEIAMATHGQKLAQLLAKVNQPKGV